MTDTITILTSRGPRMAKRWTEAGIEGYERAKNFTFRVEQVDSIQALSVLLDRLEGERRSCAIRGVLKEPPPEGGIVTRDLGTFTEVPHHWVCLDVDSYELPDDRDLVTSPASCVLHFVRTQLPEEFRYSSFHWQLSNSAGAPGKERILKAHIWFWLREPRTGEELEQWARATKAPVDITVFRTVQVHYTAAPTIDDGIDCPILVRSGFEEGLLDHEVDLVMPVDWPEERVVRAGRMEMVDPTEKGGLIGLFCRLYPPARVVDELLGGHFEFEGDSDVRLTWLRGGGAQGGAVITDDELHVYNSHSTDPLEGRAANVWDLCQVHLFGDLDPEGDRDLSDFDLPSHKAMRDFAKSLDDVKAELHTLRPSAADEFDEFEDDDPDPVQLERAAAKADAQEQYRLGRLEHLAQLQEGLKGCADVEALKAFCRDSIAADEDIDAADRDGVLRPAVQQRWTDLTGNRLKADLARRMVEPPRAASNAAGGPDWLARWCYVVELDKFFGHELKLSVSPRGFDALHSQQMPVAQDGIHREKASDYAINVWGIETVSNVIYGPGRGEVFEALGRRWANSYREDSVPVSKAGDGRAARMVEAHLARLFPDERERGLLVSWLAHQVRSPGIKVRWAPYIFGAEGTGKTFLAELLGWTMGDANVRVLSGGTLKSDFTGWAAGAAVVVIEEVYQPGHIFDTEEKLKAPISNDTVDVHRKGKDSFAAPNFTNYMLLSNHADGMPVGEGNRRLFFLSVDLTKEDAKALDREGYFANLFDVCRAAGPELRAWLLDHQPHPEFDAGGRAPETKARADVIELSRSDAESILRDAVGDAKAFTAEWARAVLKAAGLEAPSTRAWTRLVTSLGFHPVARRVRVGGKRVRIYPHLSQRGTADEVLKELIVRSVPTDFDDFSDD